VLTAQTGHRSATKDAEAHLRRAIEIAQRQSAKMLELRAATDLGRLWRQQGKAGDARTLLSEMLAWFTEGLDTTDVRDAMALRDELSGPPRRRR